MPLHRRSSAEIAVRGPSSTFDFHWTTAALHLTFAAATWVIRYLYLIIGLLLREVYSGKSPPYAMAENIPRPVAGWRGLEEAVANRIIAAQEAYSR
jgi:hypothetical protein